MTPAKQKQTIIRGVCRRYGIKRADLLGRSRRAYLEQARREAMRTLSDKVGLSSPEIARIFGIHHTSVLYHLKRP